MCVVSMISDHYDGKWYKWKEVLPSVPFAPSSPSVPMIPGLLPSSMATKEELEQLRAEVREMKELLTKALQYDRMTNQHECANDGKLERLEKVAKAAGIDCEDLFKELRKTHTSDLKKKRNLRVKRK